MKMAEKGGVGGGVNPNSDVCIHIYRNGVTEILLDCLGMWMGERGDIFSGFWTAEGSVLWDQSR